MGGTDQTHRGDHIRHYHEHRRLSAVPDAAREHGRIFIQPAHRADLLFSGGVDRGDDIYSFSRLLFVEAQNRTAAGGTAQTRVSGLLLQSRPMVHQPPLGGAARLARPAGWWRTDWHEAQNRLFPERPFLPFIS